MLPRCSCEHTWVVCTISQLQARVNTVSRQGGRIERRKDRQCGRQGEGRRVREGDVLSVPYLSTCSPAQLSVTCATKRREKPHLGEGYKRGGLMRCRWRHVTMENRRGRRRHTWQACSTERGSVVAI